VIKVVRGVRRHSEACSLDDVGWAAAESLGEALEGLFCTGLQNSLRLGSKNLPANIMLGGFKAGCSFAECLAFHIFEC
jgi:hypothetical protein